MKLADEIKLRLMKFCKGGAYEIVIPNWYHGLWEMDVMKITDSDLLVEYEIKISRADFKADFNKERQDKNKHQEIISGKRCNRFYFVVPDGLVASSEIPDYAGLIYYDIKGEYFRLIKTATLIHKNKFTNYRSIARKLALREVYLKSKK